MSTAANFTREAIIESARSCIGTPFRHQGRWRGRALDCVGLIRWPRFELLGLDDDFLRYAMKPMQAIMEPKLEEYFTPLELPVPGSILYMVDENDVATHLALLTFDGSVVHALNQGPMMVCEHRFLSPWDERVIRAFDYKEVVD